jgi:hypothetical protein
MFVSVRGSAHLTFDEVSGSFGKKPYEYERDYTREFKFSTAVEILRHDTDRLCQDIQYSDTYSAVLVVCKHTARYILI